MQIVNNDQFEDWNGETGRAWAQQADRYATMLAPFGDRIVEALAPAAGERILDIGCGNGDVSLALARRVGPTGVVVGVDLSEPMLNTARDRARAAGHENATFVQNDAQTADLGAGVYDAAVSRFGVMFFNDPVAAFTNIAASLRPGGRLAFACWRDLSLNEYVMLPAAAALEHVPVPNTAGLEGPGPYSMADADETRALLETAGFVDVALRELDEQIFMGVDVDDVTTFFRTHEFAAILFENVPDDVADRAWNAIADALRSRAADDGIRLLGAAWLVTAIRP